MRVPSPTELLNLWEWGLSKSPIQRAVSLLAAAHPELTVEQVSSLTIGQRDGLLLKLREQLFGSQLVSIAICPACGNQLELTFQTADLGPTPSLELTLPLKLTISDYEIIYRLPTSQDLLTLGPQAEGKIVVQQLLAKCVESVQHQGQQISVDTLPASVVDKIANAMDEADPLADIQLALSCPACSHQWQATFDVVTFLWSELHAWAKRVLREVHLLASSYGWREGEILDMSSQRRQLYLEMIQG